MSGGSAAAPYLSSCTVPSYLSTHFNFLYNAKEFVKTFDFDELVLWQQGLWSFQGRDTKLERILAKN